jgi:hypothetical protein
VTNRATNAMISMAESRQRKYFQDVVSTSRLLIQPVQQALLQREPMSEHVFAVSSDLLAEVRKDVVDLVDCKLIKLERLRASLNGCLQQHPAFGGRRSDDTVRIVNSLSFPCKHSVSYCCLGTKRTWSIWC